MTSLDRQKPASDLREVFGVDRLRNVLYPPRRSNVWRRSAALRQHASAIGRGLQITIMISALGLGFYGFGLIPEQKLNCTSPETCLLTKIYFTIQLCTAQYPVVLATVEVNIYLAVARILLPIATFFLSLNVVLKVVQRPFFGRVSARLHGHFVLTSDTPISLALARALVRDRKAVVAITANPETEGAVAVQRAGARLVRGSPTDQQTLARARIHAAAALIGPDDIGIGTVGVTTAAAAVAIRQRSPTSPPLQLRLRMGHQELRQLYVDRVMAAARSSAINIHLQTPEANIVRSLLMRYPSDWGRPRAPFHIHAVIVGLGDVGTELLVQLGRTAIPAEGFRCLITVVDSNVEEARRRVVFQHPGLASGVSPAFLNFEIRFVEGAVTMEQMDKGGLAAAFHAPLPATAIYVCCGDDEMNLTATLNLLRCFATESRTPPPIFVRQRGDGEIVDGLSQIHGDAMSTQRVFPFGSLDEEAGPFIRDDALERLAMLLHEDYLAVVGIGAQGRPAAVAWHDLSEDYRNESRARAFNTVSVLRNLGWRATAAGGSAPLIVASDRDADLAARQEHARWCRSRLLDGWRFAETRDDKARTHPSLRPFDLLEDAEKEKDSVLRLPALLGKAGIGLCAERRIGIWFEDDLRAGDHASRVVEEVRKEIARHPRHHVQVVSSLSSAAHVRTLQQCARLPNIGLDVVLLDRGRPLAHLEQDYDAALAHRILSAADRAFPIDLPKECSEGDRLAAFGSACDVVLVVGPTGRITRREK